MDEREISNSNLEFLLECVEEGGWPQNQLASVLGVSARTVSRSKHGVACFLAPQRYQDLARALAARGDMARAAESARRGGTTLEALGLVAVPSAAAPASSPATASAPNLALPPGTPGDRASRANAVLLAAAERLDVSPRRLRAVLAAACEHAHALGLTAPDLARGLAEGGEP